jgi:hypothetical protein
MHTSILQNDFSGRNTTKVGFNGEWYRPPVDMHGRYYGRCGRPDDLKCYRPPGANAIGTDR